MNASHLVDALRGLMNYAGGWDAPTGHPCATARDALAAYDADPQPSAGLVYLQQCEAKRDAATDDKERTFWSRQAGAVRASLARL